MIDKKTMMDCVYNQLAIDYNCSPDDFLKDGLIFTEARENKGRRPWPWVMPRLEMITMGNSVVINASADIMPVIREQLQGKTRFEALCMPFVYGVNLYYLPDVGMIAPLTKTDGYEYEMVERDHIQKIYESVGLPFDVHSPRPDVLAVLVKYKGEIVGFARASADCETMWQICIDVLTPHRGKGLASVLVNMLTLEILNRGFIPYYFTDCSNVFSQRVAIRAGYFPAWAHCYKTRLDGLLIPNKQ